MSADDRSRTGAYVALAALTLIWGSNWIAMKLALESAGPILFNVQRTLVAVAAVFAFVLIQRRPLLPASWIGVAVTGFFQTTMNFGSTTMALADGGAGRTSVLVFTMPFWTLLFAWPVLGERVRGLQWLAILCALVGLALVVEPWSWQGALRPKLWAVLSGFGWAGGTIAAKYYQRVRPSDPVTFTAWQMAFGVLPLAAIPLFVDLATPVWSVRYAGLLFWTGAISTGLGFVLWVRILRHLTAGAASLNMLAIPVIALLLSMAVFGERLSAGEWTGIALIGAGLGLVSWVSLRTTAGAVRPLR